MTPSRPAPCRTPRGFTLVEVMVALSIMSLLMVALYTTLNSTLKARDQLEIESRMASLGPGILDIIESDLRRAWILDIDGDHVFLGESRTIDGEPADSLAFLTTVDSTVTRQIDERESPSDICETGYKLRRNPVFPDVMELWRRQSFHVDDKPLSDGVWERLHDRIVSFQVRYLASVDKQAEKLADWDASKYHRLPVLVDIELALEAVPRTTEDLDRKTSNTRTLRYHRVIDMRPDSDICMRIHPLPPLFKGAAAGAGGGDDLSTLDTDGDGIPNSADDDIDGDGIPNTADPDIDGDGIENASDPTPNGGTGGGGPPGAPGLGGGSDSPGGMPGGGGGSGSGGGGNGGSGGTDFGDLLNDLLNGAGG